MGHLKRRKGCSEHTSQIQTWRKVKERKAAGAADSKCAGYRCVQPPCSCFRVLGLAAGIGSLNCAFEEQEEAEQGSVNDTVFPLPHLATAGARVRFRMAGMRWIHRGMCLWLRRPGPAPMRGPHHQCRLPDSRGRRQSLVLSLASARTLGADTRAPRPHHPRALGRV